MRTLRRTPSLVAVPEKQHPTPEERDESVSLPLPPECRHPGDSGG